MTRTRVVTVGRAARAARVRLTQLLAEADLGSAVPDYSKEWPAIPDVPMVKYVDYYRAGDASVKVTLDRLNADPAAYGRAVILPDGFDEEVVDYTYPNYTALRYLNIAGFIAGGAAGSARFRIKPNSSTLMMTDTDSTSATFNQQIPRPYLNAMQLGDGRQMRLVSYGFVLESREQPVTWHPQSKKRHPADNSGIFINNGRDAYMRECIFRGFQSDHNYPPGEMFTINDYRGQYNKYYGVEVDGRHPDTGVKQGGSPFGYNASLNGEVWDSYFHDSYVSGYTASFAGSSDSEAAATHGMRTVRTRLWRNANNVETSGAAVSPGGRFTGINHENVYGTVSHEYCSWRFNNPTRYWDNAHISLDHKLVDNPDITVLEPDYEVLHKVWNGMFVVRMSNNYAGTTSKQKTFPKVIKNGVQLTGVRFDTNGVKPADGSITLDPRQFYAIFT